MTRAEAAERVARGIYGVAAAVAAKESEGLAFENLKAALLAAFGSEPVPATAAEPTAAFAERHALLVEVSRLTELGMRLTRERDALAAEAEKRTRQYEYAAAERDDLGRQVEALRAERGEARQDARNWEAAYRARGESHAKTQAEAAKLREERDAPPTVDVPRVLGDWNEKALAFCCGRCGEPLTCLPCTGCRGKHVWHCCDRGAPREDRPTPPAPADVSPKTQNVDTSARPVDAAYTSPDSERLTRDEFDYKAFVRKVANSLPPSDFGSARAVQAMAAAMHDHFAAAEELAEAVERLGEGQRQALQFGRWFDWVVEVRPALQALTAFRSSGGTRHG